MCPRGRCDTWRKLKTLLAKGCLASIGCLSKACFRSGKFVSTVCKIPSIRLKNVTKTRLGERTCIKQTGWMWALRPGMVICASQIQCFRACLYLLHFEGQNCTESLILYLLFPNICGIYVVWQPRNFRVTIHSASEDRTHGNGPELLNLSISRVGLVAGRHVNPLKCILPIKWRRVSNVEKQKLNAWCVRSPTCASAYLQCGYGGWHTLGHMLQSHFQVIPRKFKWRNRGCQPSPCQSCHCICSPSTYQHFQKSVFQPGTIQKALI